MEHVYLVLILECDLYLFIHENYYYFFKMVFVSQHFQLLQFFLVVGPTFPLGLFPFRNNLNFEVFRTF